MMISNKQLNRLTWSFEIVREQYKFLKQAVYSARNYELVNVVNKRIEISLSLFNVGLNNYRKCLKAGQINEVVLKRIFTLYIKRARFNIELSNHEIYDLYKNRKRDCNIVNLIKQLKSINSAYCDLSNYFNCFLKD